MAKHFLLGASGAERWMNCVGSTALITALGPRDGESEWAKEGTAAHEAAAHCLEHKKDAWEIFGETFNETIVSQEMVEAIETYLAVVRPLEVPTAKVYHEYLFHEPTVHPQFGGTVDHGTATDSLLTITDFKYGEGQVVEVEENPQIMYYAYGLLLRHPSVRRVALRIVQPRAFHPDGPVRRWVTTADHIHGWVSDLLVPAMQKAEAGGSLDAGKWCRFCPAKLVCPLLKATFEAAANYDAKAVNQFDDKALGREWKQLETVQMYMKAVREETEKRLRAGKDLGGPKLVPAKTDRIYKPEAEEIFSQALGDEAFEPRKMRSPAQMEKVSPKAKALVTQYAYTPQGGYSVAPETDRREAVKIQSATERFSNFLK